MRAAGRYELNGRRGAETLYWLFDTKCVELREDAGWDEIHKNDPETCIFDVILVGKEYNPQSFHH